MYKLSYEALIKDWPLREGAVTSYYRIIIHYAQNLRTTFENLRVSNKMFLAMKGVI